MFATIITPVLCFFLQKGFPKAMPRPMEHSRAGSGLAPLRQPVRCLGGEGPGCAAVERAGDAQPLHRAAVRPHRVCHRHRVHPHTAQGTPALALGCVPGEVTLSLVGIGDGGGASESEDFQLCNICQVLFVVSNAKGKGPKTITNQPLSV